MSLLISINQDRQLWKVFFKWNYCTRCANLWSTFISYIIIEKDMSKKVPWKSFPRCVPTAKFGKNHHLKTKNSLLIVCYLIFYLYGIVLTVPPWVYSLKSANGNIFKYNFKCVLEKSIIPSPSWNSVMREKFKGLPSPTSIFFRSWQHWSWYYIRERTVEEKMLC